MSLLDKQITQYLPGVAVGIGAALVTQMVVMAALSLVRPLAKAAVKGGFIIGDAASGAYSMAESQVGKLMGTAEAQPPRRLPKPKRATPASIEASV